MIKRLNINRLAVAIVAVTMAAVYFMFIHYVPFCHDDWNFREMYLRVSGGEFALTWQRFADYVGLVRLENDGRLSDASIILFEFMPRWIYDVFFAGCCVAWMALSAKICTPGRRLNAAAMVTFWLMAVLFLPWRDWVMGSVVFSLNYVVASSVTALFLWVWTGKIHGAWTAVCVVAGFAAGCWHEGFGVPLAAGVCVMAMARRRMPDGSHLTVMAALIAGIAVAMTAPGILNRVDAEADGRLIVIGAKYVVRDLTMVVALVAACAMMLTSKRRRARLAEMWRTTPLPLFAGACAVATAITMKNGFTPRVAWPAEYFAILSLMTMAGDAWRNRGVKLCAALAYAAIVAFYAGVIKWQMKTCHDINEIVARYEASADGTVWYDYDEETPVWTLHHPSRSQMTLETTAQFLRDADPKRRLLVIRPCEPCASECRRQD